MTTQEETEALELAQSLRDASLEDAQASWDTSPQRWAARSTLLSNAADSIEHLLSSSKAARGMREALEQIADQSANQDLSHRDFRIKANECALAALIADPEK